MITWRHVPASGKGDLRHREAMKQPFIEQSTDVIFTCTAQGCLGYGNRAFADVIGQPADDIIGRNIRDLFSGQEAIDFFAALDLAAESGEEQILDMVTRTRDGDRHFLTTVNPIRDASGQVTAALCWAKDITAQRQAVVSREMGREILQVLNEAGEFQTCIQRVLDLLKRGAGFDAVGIRLQQGEDFPYYVQEGFSEDFLKTEQNLMARDATGEVCRDENGQVILACLCGLVLSGRTDQALPFFTEGGSFWTNDSHRLLDAALLKDPSFVARGVCIRHNYASMAIVPIRNGKDIVGLIQCNIRRKGFFSAETVESLEGIAAHLGGALLRKQAEAALKAEQKRLKDIIEFLPDATLAIDTAGRVIIWNRAMEELTGLKASAMVGKGDYAYSIPLYGEARQQLIDVILAGDANIADLYPSVTREGETIMTEVFCKALHNNRGAWVFAKASPLRDQSGALIGAIESIRDITESKQAEAEKKKLQAQLVQMQKMEAIGTLAGGIAHDFNNILAAILGYTEMAKGAIPPGSKAAGNLEKVLEAGERAATLVNQILTFSRRNDYERLPLNPLQIFKEAVRLLRSTLPSTIAIRQHIDPATSPILADPTQVHQIMMNLCTNAFHAMEQTGGTLDITLGNRECTRQSLQHRPEVQPGRFVEFAVADSGPGIEPEALNRIFDPYFTTKGLGKGTGMGLSIVHGIVTSHGGFISCESAPGRGTVFQVFLPAIDQPVASPAQPLEASAPRGREHILLIDDEAHLAELWQTMLVDLGYRVTMRTSSWEALTLFERQPNLFDAVITDQTMPGLTGLDLAQDMLRIRADIPIILCTGYSSLVSEEKVRARGIRGFAMKPLSKQKLANLLRVVLDSQEDTAP